MIRARVVAVAVVVVAVSTLALGAAAHAGDRPAKHAFDPLELPGVDTIKAKAKQGERPRFSWSEVDGAAEYVLVVQHLNGKPYWAWSGPETSVFLGGLQRLPDDAAGPVLTKRMQWQVVAYGEDGSILAASKWRTVGPK